MLALEIFFSAYAVLLFKDKVFLLAALLAGRAWRRHLDGVVLISSLKDSLVRCCFFTKQDAVATAMSVAARRFGDMLPHTIILIPAQSPCMRRCLCLFGKDRNFGSVGVYGPRALLFQQELGAG
ncbi:hypothetical protein ABH313_02020 [Chromobacterium vaccinii]